MTPTKRNAQRRVVAWTCLGLSLSLGACDSHRDPIADVRPGSTVPAAPAVTRETSDLSASHVEPGSIALALTRADSQGITVTWPAQAGASGYELFLAAQPMSSTELSTSATRLAELPGSATNYTLKSIGAGGHLFITVVAKGTEGPAWGSVYQQLPGGMGAKLVSSVESYHLAGPGVLGIVLREESRFDRDGELIDDRGAQWQGGEWTVTRANGQRIEVLKSYRRSSSRGLSELRSGFGTDSGRKMHIEHRVYLELSEAVGSHEVLHVAHGGDEVGLDLHLPLSDLYTETPVVQVNQVGYNPHAAQRSAYLYEWLGDGGGLSLDNFSGRAELLLDSGVARKGLQWLEVANAAAPAESNDGAVREIDLSSVPVSETARYRLRIPGVGVSVPTAVSNASAVEAFRAVARGMHFQRRCEAWTAQDATPATRGEAHCKVYEMQGRGSRDGFFEPTTPKGKSRRIEGGHYDAGDFDVRPYHVMVAQYLLRAFEMSPKKFGDGQFHAPSRQNGIPDLLDEALHSVEMWEGLQDADGGVREGVESTRHPWGYYYASQDQLDYFTYDATPGHTALVAGLFAQSAYLVKPYDAKRSARLLAAAQKAYAYAKQNKAPPEYLLYPAGELARLGAGDTYGPDFVAHWRAIDRYGRGAFDHLVDASKIYPGSFSRDHPAMTDYTIGYLGAANRNGEIAKVVREQLDRIAESVLASIRNASGHRSAKAPQRPNDWGQFVAQARHFDGVFQKASIAGDEGLTQYAINSLSLAADAVLGCNPMGMSFISGLGSTYPRQPLQLDSLAALAEGKSAVPGLAVYGPVGKAPKAHYYAPVMNGFYPSFDQRPPMLRYADSALAVVTNEFSVWETQAPTVLLFATLLPEGYATPE